MRELLRRVCYAIRHRRLEADLAEEMAFHGAMKEGELEEGGADCQQARLRARRAFGSAALAQDQVRDVWIWPWLQDVSQDVRFGLRLLLKDRWFTLAVLVALALGLGASTTMFSFMNGYVIGGLPFHDPDRIVSFGTRDANGRDRGLVSYLDLEDWRVATKSFADVSLFSSVVDTLTVSGDGQPAERFAGPYISANAFRVL